MATALSLKRAYGEAVKVEYYDLSDRETHDRFPEVLDFVGKNRYPLPVVTVQGEVVTVGYISFWVLNDAVQAHLRPAG